MVSTIVVDCITNLTSYDKIPEFTSLNSKLLKSKSRGIRINSSYLTQSPFVCENYKYDIVYLSKKSYPDLILFFYNRNRFLKYMGEMSTEPSIKPMSDINIIRENIKMMLVLLFQCTVELISTSTNAVSYTDYSKMVKHTIMWGPAPSNTKINKIIWLNDGQNNPTFSQLIQSTIEYYQSLIQTKVSIISQIKQKLENFKKHMVNNSRPSFTIPTTTTRYYSSSIINEAQLYIQLDEAYNTKLPENINALTKNPYDNINSLDDTELKKEVAVLQKNIFDMIETMDTVTSIVQKLSTTSFNNAQITKWQTRTKILIEHLNILCLNYLKATHLKLENINKYTTERESNESTTSSSHAESKKIFPTYYELMEEAYRLSQSYYLTPEQLFGIIHINSPDYKENSELKNNNVDILKINPAGSSDNTKSGYKINIAIELHITDNFCTHLDFMNGHYVGKQQNIHIIRYKPPYFIDDILSDIKQQNEPKQIISDTSVNKNENNKKKENKKITFA